MIYTFEYIYKSFNYSFLGTKIAQLQCQKKPNPQQPR